MKRKSVQKSHIVATEAHKMQLLRLIYDNKDVLFGRLDSQLTQEQRNDKWEEIFNTGVGFGVDFGAGRDYTYLRDEWWGSNQKRSFMTKKDRLRKSGAGGEDGYNARDLLIWDIIGRNSPVIEGLPVAESWQQYLEESDHGSEDEIPPSQPPTKQSRISIATAPHKPAVKLPTNIIHRSTSQNNDENVAGPSHVGQPLPKKPILKRPQSQSLATGAKRKHTNEDPLLDLKRRALELTICYLEFKIARYRQQALETTVTPASAPTQYTPNPSPLLTSVLQLPPVLPNNNPGTSGQRCYATTLTPPSGLLSDVLSAGMNLLNE